MPRTFVVPRFILMTLLSLLCTAFFTARAQEAHGAFWTFSTRVSDILRGKCGPEVQACIDPNARFVMDGKARLLLAVINAPERVGLQLDPTYQAVAIRARTNDAEDAGYLEFTTRLSADTTRVRYHSVFFLRDSTGEYHIEHWHADGIR